LSGNNHEGYKAASATAQGAARQQPKEMRSASLSFVKRAIKERWKPATRLNKHIKDAKKSVAARYLQLKSNHAVTGVHLLRINKVQDARCWWCGGSRQTVARLMLECRKWRGERDIMIRKLNTKKVTIIARRDQEDLKTVFDENIMVTVLQFIESTEVGTRPIDNNKSVES
jgi:hypothetical protein